MSISVIKIKVENQKSKNSTDYQRYREISQTGSKKNDK